MEMDRPSIALARALDSIVIEGDQRNLSGEGGTLTMACTECGDSLCEVEHGDTMRVLFNTALAHVCGA